jgi:hypothetical protein
MTNFNYDFDLTADMTSRHFVPVTLTDDFGREVTLPQPWAAACLLTDQMIDRLDGPSGVTRVTEIVGNNLFVEVKLTKTGAVVWALGFMGKRCSSRAALDAVCAAIAANQMDTLKARMAGQRVELKAEVNYTPGHAPTVDLKGKVMLSLNGRLFHVGAIPHGQQYNKSRGTKGVGPYAFAFQAPVVVCSGDNGYQSQLEASIKIQSGTRLLIDGVTYVVRHAPNRNITLEVVA